MRIVSTAATVTVLGLALVGCSSGPKMVEQPPKLSLKETHKDILQGETTTIFADTANMMGRDVKVKWSSTLGQVKPEANGRIARFTSDVPGTAVVSVEVNVDGEILRKDTTITVNGLRGFQPTEAPASHEVGGGPTTAPSSEGPTTAPSNDMR